MKQSQVKMVSYIVRAHSMKRFYMFAILILAAMSVVSCSKSQETEEEEVEEQAGDVVSITPRQMRTVGIKVGKVERRQLTGVLRVNGQFQLNPQDRAEVASLMGGIVQRIVVTEGQKVKAGQVVAFLENTQIVELQKDALVASKDAELARQELERQNSLYEQGAGVEKTRQQAKVQHEVALARLLGLRQQLQQLGINPSSVEHGNISNIIPIKSPIAGSVSRIRVSTGSYVDMQTPLMDVANVSAVYCELKVYDKDIEQVVVGQHVDIRHSNMSSSDVEATVTQINATIDPDTKAFSVHARLVKHDDHTLVPGMYVNALIQTGRHLCDAVPSDAIVSSEGKYFVFVREKEKAEDGVSPVFRKVEVVPGAEELGYTQISTASDHLTEGTHIVVEGAYYLSSMLGDHGEED